MTFSLPSPLRAAFLSSALLLPACSSGSEGPVVVPWPHSMAGYDAALVGVLEKARADVLEDPRDAAVWLRLGMLFEAHLMLELAESSYERAVELDGQAARVWYRLALMRGKNGNVDGALDAYRALEALDASYAPAWRRKGWLLLGAGRPADAAAAFERGLSIDPSEVVCRLGLVEVELEQGRAEEALEQLAGLELVPPASRALFHRLRGLALSRLSRFEEAEPELIKGRGARVSGPDPWMKEVAALKVGESAILLQASRKIESGQAELGLQMLLQLEARDPDDPRILVRKGRALARLGDWPGAAAAFSRTLELDPDDLGLALALASAMVKADDVAGALDAAAHLVDLDPELPDAHELRAELLLGQGRAAEAIAAVGLAREHGVETAALEVVAGKALLDEGEQAAALAAFEAATMLDPGNADALAGKGLAALGLGDRGVAAAAVAELRKVNAAHPLLEALEGALAEGPEASPVSPQAGPPAQTPDPDRDR
ncbi:MAG: tetratricopeptide repeat protein [Planctomycetota bacterium]|nr:tetratricopeptide repeat protein [Planctomycetota bacterium]